MADGIAYRSSAPEVLEVWNRYIDYRDEITERRKAAQEKYGRPLMVSRDWGSGSSVVGFARGDEPFDEKALRVAKWGHLVPRLSSKAGKAINADLADLRLTSIDLPGMPSFYLAGLRILAPAMFKHEGAVWLYWSEAFAGRCGPLGDAAALGLLRGQGRAGRAAGGRPMSAHRKPGPAVIGGAQVQRGKHQRVIGWPECVLDEFARLRFGRNDERQRENDRALGAWIREQRGVDVEAALASIYGPCYICAPEDPTASDEGCRRCETGGAA